MFGCLLEELLLSQKATAIFFQAQKPFDFGISTALKSRNTENS